MQYSNWCIQGQECTAVIFLFAHIFYPFTASACRSLHIHHALQLTDLLNERIQFLLAADVKAYGNRRLLLLTGAAVDIADIDLALGKDLGDIHQKTGTVVGIHIDLCQVMLILLGLRLLPLCLRRRLLSISDIFITLTQSVL